MGVSINATDSLRNAGREGNAMQSLTLKRERFEREKEKVEKDNDISEKEKEAKIKELEKKIQSVDQEIRVQAQKEEKEEKKEELKSEKDKLELSFDSDTAKLMIEIQELTKKIASRDMEDTSENVDDALREVVNEDDEDLETEIPIDTSIEDYIENGIKSKKD